MITISLYDYKKRFKKEICPSNMILVLIYELKMQKICIQSMIEIISFHQQDSGFFFLMSDSQYLGLIKIF